MDKLIELLKQIQELAGVAVDALEGGGHGGGADAPHGGGAPGGGAPSHGGPPPHEGGGQPPQR